MELTCPCGKKFIPPRSLGGVGDPKYCTPDCGLKHYRQSVYQVVPVDGEPTQPIRPAANSRTYTADEVEFMTAMDRFKREMRRPFPTWAEALGVLKSLGYAKPPAEG